MKFSPIKKDYHCRMIQLLASCYINKGKFSLSLIRIRQRVADLMINGERFEVGEVERRDDILDITLIHKEIDANANIISVRCRVSVTYVKASRLWITTDGHRVMFSTKTLLLHVHELLGTPGSKRVKFMYNNVERDGVVCIPPNCPLSVTRVTCWVGSKLVS